MVVTDFRSNVHVFDVATGSEVGTLHLTDKARRLCVSARHENQAWIDVADGKSVLVDVGTTTATPAKEPDWCKGYSSFDRTCAATSASCTEERVAGDGFQSSYVLRTDSPAARVAVGTRHPGTQTAMAAGLDAASHTTWLAILPKDPAVAPTGAPVADLAQGKLFATFQADHNGYVLAALDAATGRRDWEVPVPRSSSGSGPEGITATATRVYIPHWTWLDIFQTDGGRLVGTVGIW